jgi:hypothetical protein
MSTTQTTSAADLNAATATARVAQATAVNTEASAPRTPAKRPSAATRKSAQSAKSGTAKVAGAKRTTGKPAAAQPAKLTVVKPAGPSNADKKVAASMLVDVIGAAFAKLSDAQLKKAGISRETAGYIWTSALNYIPTPADKWHPALPPRSHAGGRGSTSIKAAASA